MYTVRGLARSQHRVVLWRPLVLDRPALHSLAHLAYGVPWYATARFGIKAVILTCANSILVRAPGLVRCDCRCEDREGQIDCGAEVVYCECILFPCSERHQLRPAVQSTLKGQYTSRNEKLGSEKKCVIIHIPSEHLIHNFPGHSTLSLESACFSAKTSLLHTHRLADCSTGFGPISMDAVRPTS